MVKGATSMFKLMQSSQHEAGNKIIAPQLEREKYMSAIFVLLELLNVETNSRSHQL